MSIIAFVNFSKCTNNVKHSGCVDLKYSTLYQSKLSKRNLHKYIDSFMSPPFNVFIKDPLPPSLVRLKSSTIPAYLN